MHETILRRARRAGPIVDRFVRRDRIAVVFQPQFRRYPRLPRNCAACDHIAVTCDGGSPKRKPDTPYPSRRRVGSSTPTQPRASCPRIRAERSIRKPIRPTLDVCRSQRVASPATRRSAWDCIRGY